MNFSAAELTAGIEVRLARDGDLARWDAFVAGCAEATFFHRAELRSPHLLLASGARGEPGRHSASCGDQESPLWPLARVAAVLRVRRRRRDRPGGGPAPPRGGARARRGARRSPSRAQEPRRARAGLAAAGALRDLPQADPPRQG